MSDPTADIFDRLATLHPRLIDLSLDRLRRLLAELGHPERRLPPVIHVAGTNGKGSTCAFLRAIGEAAGWRVHVYTSPHLVRFNERIRVAGEIVADAMLLDALEAVERVNAGAPITVFEVITAVAFKLFAEMPAELCVVEVGLGGRGDATNVIAHPAACAITSISLDHAELLGDRLALIAAEKAGILKPGVPCATGLQSDRGARRDPRRALRKSAPGCWRAAATGHRGRRRRGPALRGCGAARSTCPLPALPRHAPERQCGHRGRRAACGKAWRAGHRLRRHRPRRMARAHAAPQRAGSPHACRPDGSCGSTAATIRAPARRSRNSCPPGPTGRCT